MEQSEIKIGSVLMAVNTIETDDNKIIKTGQFYKVIHKIDGDEWDYDWVELEGFEGNLLSSGLFIAAELIIHPAQEKLDQLKKYFLSGNDVPVDRASIAAKDFWKIYNGG